MDLQKLELFASICEHGNLSKAALALDTVPSVLSRQLAAFEKESGGKLFHRTGRGMTLTQLGHRILPRVELILDQHRQLLQDIRSQEGVISGDVRLGIVPSLAQPIASTLFRSILENYPQINLQILEGATSQLDSWRSDDLVDITVLFRRGSGELQNEDSLGEVDTYLVGPSGDAITRDETVGFCELAGLPLVLAPLPNGLRADVEAAASRLGISLRIVLETNSLGVQAELATNGGAYTIVAGHALVKQMRAGIQASRIVAPGIVRTVALCLASHRPATEATRVVARLARLHLENSLRSFSAPVTSTVEV